MATKKISALTEATSLTGAEEAEIVQGGDSKRVGIDTMFSTANAVWHGWTFLTAPLTSTSWDGDAYSTSAKTLIDLSSVFGVPAGVKAVSIRVSARDSASGTTTGLYVLVSPNNTSGSTPIIARPSGRGNDEYDEAAGTCPCDANGDIYYQIVASGAGTMDVHIQIWGYCL
jgi:hypothetical protein